ncbi:MAG: 3-dehydroquinate synthase [Proteobacteria bacterium]|nr:3-dehydroquinate synthase [Pseudomonadota bacterium]
MTTVLNVELGARSYPIHIGAGLLDDGALFASLVKAEQVMVLSNEVVAPLYLERLRTHFAGRRCETLVLPDGEAHKTLDSFSRVMGFMLEKRLERGALLVALGGGVIGDLGGFAAACYQRGIDFLQVPTTLLAQVDSSVGGKTAVNHPLGKNMIGAFHQPIAVVADTDTLATLPARELNAGLAEVIKYGLIRDLPFFEWLEAHIDALLAREPAALAEAVRRSCQNKAEVVAADERETGERATLNLGHTFGHAIETASGYGNWLHGEAVGAGMCMAARLSARAGWLTAAELERTLALIGRAQLPTAPPAGISAGRFRELMLHDKKNVGGRIRLVLLKGLGKSCVTRDYDDAQLEAVLRGEPAP